jgi:hypothetical protein
MFTFYVRIYLGNKREENDSFYLILIPIKSFPIFYTFDFDGGALADGDGGKSSGRREVFYFSFYKR